MQFCYLPNCRVLKDIRSKPLTNKDGTTLEYAALNDDLKTILYDGDIDFGKSNTKSNPCKTYHINHPEKETLFIVIENCQDKTIVKESTLTGL